MVSNPQIFRFGLFEADLNQRTLTRRGLRVKIQEQPFQVLIMLLERPGEILAREELRQKLWAEGTYVDFDGSLNVIVKKLRSAIDDDSDNPRFIETVPRRGYRFISPVTVVKVTSQASDLTVPARSATNLVESAVPAPHEMGFRPFHLIYISLFGVLAIGLLAGVGNSWRRRVLSTKTIVVPNPNLGQVALRKSVAVLGFQSISGRTSDEWMATAISEMLSTELAAGEKLRIISAQDVANLRLSSPWSQTDSLDQRTAARIGTALNSDLLVLGSFVTIGKSDQRQLRVDVRLQDAKSGEILAESAEIGSAENLFHIITQVGVDLRDRMSIPRLQDREEAGLLASLPSNTEAARLYSLGLVKLREYDYPAARGLFEQATKADPSFPLGFSSLSQTDIFLGHDDQAKAEAKRAVNLSSNLSRVQRMQIEANYYQAIGDREKAADIYRVLLNLFPDNLDYGLHLAKLELEAYHPDEALGTISQLRQLPPPMRDDPGLDLREGGILYPRDPQASDRLWRSAAAKAHAQGKKFIYAKAEQNLCYSNRQHLQSPPECQEAYDIYLAAGNRLEAGSCLELMAEANRQTDHAREAIPLYEQSLRISKEAGSREMTGVVLNNLSLVLDEAGQWASAERSYIEAAHNFEIVNDRANGSEAISNTANIEVLRGHSQAAAVMYRKAWDLAVSSGRARPEYPHFQYASLLLMQGDPERSKEEVEPQIASLRSYGGDPFLLASALSVSGDVATAEGNFDQARKQYQEALTLLETANSSVVPVQISLAELSLAEGHPESAEPLLRTAIRQAEKAQTTSQEIRAYTTLARAILPRNPDEARTAMDHALNLADLRDFPALKLPLQILQSQRIALTAKTGTSVQQDIAGALQQIVRVAQESKHLGLYTINCEARLAQGEILLKEHAPSGRAVLANLATETHNRGLELFSRRAQQAVSAPGSQVDYAEAIK